MKITKLGHCCLLIEEQGIKILTDPGAWTKQQDEVSGISLILITHEHADHLHLDSLRRVIINNPQARIITNASVGKLLEKEKITYEVIREGESQKFMDIMIEAFGSRHATIYQEFGQVENTGFFINNKLFYPGDAFTNPGKPVEVLALPMAGTWLKISESIDYAKKLQPKICFPVHDGMMSITEVAYKILDMFLSQSNIKFTTAENQKEFEV